MKKKLVLLVTTLAMAVSAAMPAVYAAEGIGCEVQVADTTITCTVTADEVKGEGISLFVGPKGSALTYNNIYAVTVLKSGNLTYSFKMPQGAMGDSDLKFTVYLKNGSDAGKEFDFVYVDSTVMNKIIADVKGATAATLKTVIAKSTDEGLSYKSALESIGMNIADFDNLSDTEKAGKIIFAEDLTAMSTADFAALFNYAVNLAKITEDNADVDAILKEINTKFVNGANEVEYKNADESTRTFVSAYIKSVAPFEKCFDYESAYEAANALYLLNKARTTDVKGILGAHYKALGLESNEDYKTYAALTDTTDADDTLVEKLAASNAATLATLQSYLKTAVSGNSGSNPGAGSNPGGGGGGGAYSPSKVDDKVKNDDDSDTVIVGNTVPVVPSPKFTDIGGHSWAKEAIEELYKEGVVKGVDEENFCPADMVTREQMITMVVAAAGLGDETATCDFDDVKTNAWYYKSVAIGVKKGIVFGVSENNFGVGLNITRQDAAVMIYRGMKAIGKTVNEVRDESNFADKSEISPYALDAVEKLYKTGIISGNENNEFAPMNTCTRAEAAKMIYDAFVK